MSYNIRLSSEDSYWDSDGILKRFKFNPVLTAVKNNQWESKMVYAAQCQSAIVSISINDFKKLIECSENYGCKDLDLIM